MTTPESQAAKLPDHDCAGYAVHGPLARRHYGVAIEVCMKCNRWRSPRYLINDWQPWSTMTAWINGKRR